MLEDGRDTQGEGSTPLDDEPLASLVVVPR